MPTTEPRQVYLAGSHTSKEGLKAVRAKINALGGFTVVTSWLDSDPRPHECIMGTETGDAEAIRDIQEVTDAEVFILDTLLRSTGGGYDVELGVALSTGSVTYRVGPARNIFHKLVMYEVPDWQSLYARLKRW